VRRQITGTRMRSNLVVMLTPAFDDDFHVDSVSEPFHRETLVAELTVEGFIGSVLLRLEMVPFFRTGG